MAPSAPVLVLLSLLALPATSTAASPRAPVPFHVELDAPAGCTSVEAVVRSVETRVGRTRRARPDEGGPHFKLRISRAGARVRGVLSVVDERGGTDDRTVEGASCEEIVEALSLTMALSLSGDGKPPPAPRGPDRAPPQSRSRSAGASRATASASAPPARSAAPGASAPAPAPVPPAPEPQPPPVPPPPASPPPPEVVEQAVPPPPPPPPPAVEAQPPPEPEAPGRPIQLAIGLAAIVAQPVSPPLSVGGALTLALAWPNADAAAMGPAPTRVDLGVIHAANDYVQSPRGLVARWTAVALGVCPPLGVGGRFELQPCGRGTVGWLSARDRSVAYPTPAGRWWFSLGALLRVAIPVGGGFFLEASGGVEFPLVERRFTTSAPDMSVGETPRAAGWGGLGVGRSL